MAWAWRPRALAGLLSVLFAMPRECTALCDTGSTCGLNNDCPMACDSVNNWGTLATRALIPEPRAYHSSIEVHHPIYGNVFIVQGGARSAGGTMFPRLYAQSDGYMYLGNPAAREKESSTITSLWRKLMFRPSANVTFARVAHSGLLMECPDQPLAAYAELARNSSATGTAWCIYYYGGFSVNSSSSGACAQTPILHDDLYIYYINGDFVQWGGAFQTTADGINPGKRYGHIAQNASRNMYIQGGFKENGQPVDDNRIWQYNPTTVRWSWFEQTQFRGSLLPNLAFAGSHYHWLEEVYSQNDGYIAYGGFRGNDPFANDNKGIYFVRTVSQTRNATGYVGTWNAIDICNGNESLAAVSCPSTDVDYNVALAGSRSTHVDDALFVFGGTANKTQFTHPFENCNSTMESALANTMQVVLYTRSEASKYNLSRSLSCDSKDLLPPVGFQYLNGVSFHALNKSVLIFGGMDPFLSMETMNSVWENYDMDNICDYEWSLAPTVTQPELDQATGQVVVVGDIEACRSVACKDLTTQENCTSNISSPYAKWLTCQWNSRQSLCFAVPTSDSNSETQAVTSSVCPDGDSSQIMQANQECPQYVTQANCTAATTSRMAGFGSGNEGKFRHIPMCKWDTDIRGIFQFGGQQQQQQGVGPSVIDAWLFRPDVNTWHKLVPENGDAGAAYISPTARQDPAIQVISPVDGNAAVMVLLFGGLSYSSSAQQTVYQGDTWIGVYVSDVSTGYNPQMSWTPFCGVDAAVQPQVSGLATNQCGPVGRQRATTYLYHNVFYMFGGEGENGLLNDMWSYNITTHTWDEILPQSSQWPTARARTAFTRLFVTAFACGIETMADESIGMMFANESIGMMFGGQIAGTNFLEASLLAAVNDTWAFSFANRSWYNCSTNITGTLSVTPSSTYNLTEMPALIGPVSGGIHPHHYEDDADGGAGQVMVVYGGMHGFSTDLYGRSYDADLPFDVAKQLIYQFDPSKNQWSVLTVTGFDNFDARFDYSGIVYPSTQNGLDQPSASEIYIFGGLQGQWFQKISATRTTMFGCPEGQHYDNEIKRCEYCPEGSYWERPSSYQVFKTNCTVCPTGLTASIQNGSKLGLDGCDKCSAGYCSLNGACKPSPGARATCECHACFSGTRCETDVCLLVIIPVMIVAALVAVFVGLWRTESKNRKAGYEKAHGLNEQLIDQQARAQSFRRARDELVQAYDIDPEEITRDVILGRGSQGEVWRGHYNDEMVAIKTLSASHRELKTLTGTVGVLDESQDMEREMTALMRMRHVNLVKFLGTGTFDDNTRFIVLEYMVKGSLRDFLDDDKEPEMVWAEKVRMVKECASGMAYIHRSRRIHRDLKSPNLLISASNALKVADFGSVIQSGKMSDTEAGSPLWMSPELMKREQVGQPTDVFSFAVVMWEVLTRQQPWDHIEQLMMIYDEVQRGRRLDIPDAYSYGSEAQQRYCDLIVRCWDHKPELRPSFPESLKILQEVEQADQSRGLEQSAL